MIQLSTPMEKASDRLPRRTACSGKPRCRKPMALKEAAQRITTSRNRYIRFGETQDARNRPNSSAASAAKALSLFCVTRVIKPSVQ